jgi:hypothetical protein
VAPRWRHRHDSEQDSCRAGGIIGFACFAPSSPPVGRTEFLIAPTATEFSFIRKKNHNSLKSTQQTDIELI